MKGILLDNETLHIRPQLDPQGRILRGLVIGETTYQNQYLLLLLHQGELKERPAVGVGISDMLLDHDTLLWRSRIREQLEMDGQHVHDVSITSKGIHIHANYPQ